MPWPERSLAPWLLTLLVASVGCGPGVGPVMADDDLIAELAQAVTEAHEDRGTAGVAWALLDGSGSAPHTGAAGLADTATSSAWSPTDPYPIGSVTKLYTLALVLQLVDEGALTLDDPLDQWVETPFAERGVGLRHLIQHTSGIASYNYIGDFDQGAAWTSSELVDWAAEHEPELRFSPGSAWEYSNTNYVLLGLVVEAADGRPYETALQERLLTPLALDATSLPNPNPSGLVRGYDEEGTDLTDTVDPSMAWAAGGIVSTPADVARFTQALFHGEVVSQARLDEIGTPLVLPDGSQPGVGLGAFGSIDETYGGAWGHTGGTSGHQAYTTHVEHPDLVLVVFANHEDARIQEIATRGWEEVLP